MNVSEEPYALANVKLYQPKVIAMATFWGGPLAAGCMMYWNFKRFGEPGKAKISLVISVLATILIFGFLFAIPEEIADKIPNILIPFVYSGIAILLVYQYQNKGIEYHQSQGGGYYTYGRAVWMGLLSAVGTVLIALLVALAMPGVLD